MKYIWEIPDLMNSHVKTQDCEAVGRVFALVALIIYVFLITGCSVPYQGERVQTTQEMLKEIDNLSTDDAIEILKSYFQKKTERYESTITSDEWERMKDEMNSKPWLERQRTTANMDQSRRAWDEWIVTGTAIVHHRYLEDYYRWVEVRQSKYEQQSIPPETEVTKWRFVDIVELRNVTHPTGLAGLRMYCDIKAGSGPTFWLYPDNPRDLALLTKAFIKLCPNIKP